LQRWVPACTSPAGGGSAGDAAEQGAPPSGSTGEGSGAEAMWGMQTFIRVSGKAGCATCGGTGEKPCGQCAGGGVNQEDLFQGRFKKGDVCWLCKGARTTMCGDCAGDMTDVF